MLDRVFIPMLNRFKQIRTKLLDSFWKYSEKKLQAESLVDISTPHVKLGTAYGGWSIPTHLLNSDSLCYCVGAGEDISFDIELIRQYNCHVYTFDPTPRASQHIQSMINNTREGLPTPINASPEDCYTVSPEMLEKLHFHEFGLWSANAIMKFYAPSNPAHVSHSILNLQNTRQYFSAQCLNLSTLMKRLNHSSLDLLKLDIEGAEYAVIQSMMKAKIRPRILCVEFDEGHHPLNFLCFSRIRTAVRQLKAYGYSVSHIDRWNYTFLFLEK
jgi:FkbM family methyltransferase